MAVSRRTVTVLFADVADSTKLGERLDPEALRGVITGWFDDARTVIERHGGTVEKFIGDAVMGVFGVPTAHEDDALRAVRAALELREHASATTAAGDEKLWIRIGINTGEVVAGDPRDGHAFVSGDAVNTAKRLEQAARSGEILIGADTEQLVRGTALLEPADPVVAKGKSAPVTAWRVLAAIPGLPAITRRTDTPLVGRTDELDRLRRAYERAIHERTCVLFTVLGPAGIGKSRLVAELLEQVRGGASVLVGRCLAYGDGISFWPVYEMLRDLGGSAGVSSLIGDADERELVVERLAGATARGRNAGTHETYWAFRKVCETLARTRPLILCFEDVHWAEPTMLDLIEYLAAWIRDAPILLLCIARPEFLDARPAWLGGGAEGALALAPLSHADSLRLLDGLGATGAAQGRIAEAADGNPLYAEQMAAMVAEGAYADGLFTFPPTIQALLAARLDRLTPGERSAIERAAVAGREFWRDAIVALSSEQERGSVDASLMSLVRKELVRPHPSATRPDDAFRFLHALIRDAAYAGISKETRSDLHERFADWLAVNAGDRAVELEEIIGYHLEQAFQYREELFPSDDESRRIGNRAGELLGSAGHRALARGDVPAAINLLARATALLDEEHPIRAQALPELGSALMRAGDFARADEVLTESLTRAAGSGDTRLELRTLIEREFFRAFTNPESSTDELVHVAEQAIPLLEQLGDEFGLAKAWWLRSEADVIAGRWGARADALERALVHARRAGSRESLNIVALLAQALEYGPTPVGDALRRCATLRAESAGERTIDAAIMGTVASLTAMEGRFDEARRLYADSNGLHEELGLNYRRAGRCLVGATIESLAGNLEAAVGELRRGYDALEQMGERGTRSTVAAFLAHALAEQARFAEADEYARISEQTGALADVVTQAIWRCARALVLVHDGDDHDAERLAREAVELAEGTDFLDLHARTALTLASVLRGRGREGEAAALSEDARRAYERKGNRVAAMRLAEPAEAR